MPERERAREGEISDHFALPGTSVLQRLRSVLRFDGKRTHQELVGKSNRKVARDVGEQTKIIEIGELEHAHHFRVPVQIKINTEKNSLINT